MGMPGYLRWGRGLSVVLLVLQSHSVRANDVASRFPGVGFTLSRVVMMESGGSHTVTFVNHTDNVYLVQSQLWLPDGTTGWPQMKMDASRRLPLMVTPPLNRVERQGDLLLRLLEVDAAPLPRDRESLFFLSARAIPGDADPSRPVQGKESLSVALRYFIKVFWRPEGLDEHAIWSGEVAGKLRFSRRGEELHVINPTPYYITFYHLSVSGRKVSGASLRAMVAPFGESDYPVAGGAGHGEVEWQIVDEFGLLTRTGKQVLN